MEKTAALGRLVLMRRRQDPPLHPGPLGPVAGGGLEVLAVECRPGGLGLLVVDGWVGVAEEDAKQFAVVAADEGRAEPVVVPPPAEPLLAEVVGHPAAADRFHHRPQLHHVGRVDVADLQGEAVAGQVPQPQLVPVPRAHRTVRSGAFIAMTASGVVPQIESTCRVTACASFSPA